MNNKKIEGMLSKLPKGNGFTLLYAIIMVGAVLFITTAGYSLLSRQVRFATLSNDSQDAYYAAESAGECILSYAQQGIFDKKIVQDITCDGATYHADGSDVQTFSIVVTNPSTHQQTIASVNVDTVTNTIESVGYNSPDATLPTRIQRAITFKYKSYCPIGGDVMLVVDLSGSISDSELVEYKKSLTYFVNKIFAADANTRVGIVEFGTAPKLAVHLTNNKAALLTEINNMDISTYTGGIGRGTNTQGGLREALYEFQGKQETSHAFDPDTVPMGTMNDWTTITTPIGGYNRDDNEYANYYVVFTDGASNTLIPHGSSVKVDGVTVRPGEFTLNVCDTNPLTSGSSFGVYCGGKPNEGKVGVTTMQNLIEEADIVKANGTVFELGIAVDDTACAGHSCSWYSQKVVTQPHFYYKMDHFISSEIDAATDDLLSCTKAN